MKAKLLKSFKCTVNGRVLEVKAGQILDVDLAGTYFSVGLNRTIQQYRDRKTAQYINMAELELIND